MRAQALTDFKAVYVRQADVQQNEIGHGTFLRQTHCIDAPRYRCHGVTVRFKIGGQHFGSITIIFYDHHVQTIRHEHISVHNSLNEDQIRENQVGLHQPIPDNAKPATQQRVVVAGRVIQQAHPAGSGTSH